MEGAHEHLATNADVIAVKADVTATEARLIKWIVGSVLVTADIFVGVAAIAVSAALLLQRMMGDHHGDSANIRHPTDRLGGVFSVLDAPRPEGRRRCKLLAKVAAIAVVVLAVGCSRDTGPFEHPTTPEDLMTAQVATAMFASRPPANPAVLNTTVDLNVAALEQRIQALEQEVQRLQSEV